MQTVDCSWLPSTPTQRAFVFTLALLLMLNTTVVLLLITGDLPVLADLRSGPTPAYAEQDRTIEIAETRERRALSQGTDDPGPVLTDEAEPHVEVAPLDEDQLAPTPVASVKRQALSPEPIKPTEQAQPEQDDPPVTFFGITLD